MMKNESADTRTLGDQGVRITVRKKKAAFLVPPISWIIRTKQSHTVSLDHIGTQIWNWCDGKRTVEDVIDEFAKTYSLSFHEARVSVTGHLQQLVKRGVLAVAVKKTDTEDELEV